MEGSRRLALYAWHFSAPPLARLSMWLSHASSQHGGFLHGADFQEGHLRKGDRPSLRAQKLSISSFAATPGTRPDSGEGGKTTYVLMGG